MSPKQWLIVRCLIVGFWAYGGLTSTFHQLPLSSLDLAFAFVSGLFGSRFWIFRAYKRAGPTINWLAPSWYLNPFQSGQPFQFIHLAAVSFVWFSLVAFLHQAIASSWLLAAWPTEAFAGAFGSGIWAGIWWAVLSHKKDFHFYAEPRA